MNIIRNKIKSQGLFALVYRTWVSTWPSWLLWVLSLWNWWTVVII